MTPLFPPKNASDVFGRIAGQAVLVATALGLWGALVLLFAAPLALSGPVSWRQAVRFGVSFWALWLVFLPAVAWLAIRYPIERKRFLRNAGLHVLACLLVVVISRTTFRSGPWMSPPLQRSAAPGRPAIARDLPPGPPGAFDAFLGLRVAFDVLVYWSLVGIGAAITNFRSSEARERRAAELEASLTRAQLQALRMQLNPHFLFNTLNSISGLVYISPRAADEMLGELSELLRRSLDSMEEQEIPLERELEFIGGYIGLEQKRFGERLQVDQSVPEDLRTALVPALILQPLVENAIRHGIEPRRGPGVITIEARQEDGRLHLSVRDNGRGLSDAISDGSARQGIGLANTRARLQALYGPDQSFRLGPAAPHGCRIDIRLPLHVQPAGDPPTSPESAA